MANLFRYTPLFIFYVLTGLLANAQKKYIFERPEMGSPFTITIEAADSMAASIAATAAFRKADSLNAILSDYIDSSEINRLSATSGQGRFIPVSAPLFTILQRSIEAARLSHGRYDVTVGPVVRLWRKARKTRTFPDANSLQAALQRTGYRYLHLDTLHQSVWLERSGMLLDVGGLGKGFVAQAALNLLIAQGFDKAMVNAGGKIVVGQAPIGQQGWLIAINAPNEKEELLPGLLSLNSSAIATSGDIYQYVEINGRRYSHIVDPRTGIGLTRRRNVTAIAPDGTQADWLATACSILSYKQSLKLIRHIPEAALLVTENRRGQIIRRQSSTFSKYQRSF